jgi:PEP-CTERM motif
MLYAIVRNQFSSGGRMKMSYRSNLLGLAMLAGALASPSAFASVVVVGSDNGLQTSPAVVAAASETLTFDWAYQSFDFGGPSWDPAGYYINASFFQLTNDNGADNQSGTIQFGVLAGDSYGFYISSLDNFGGGANFEATQVTAVPEPGTLALFGLAALALGAARKRQQA